MWSGPTDSPPGCTCGFIDGYHSWHQPTCALVRRGKRCECVGYRWEHQWGCSATKVEEKLRFLADPTVRDSVQADIEYLERFIAAALANKASDQALKNVRKQLALLKETRDKYEEAIKLSVETYKG